MKAVEDVVAEERGEAEGVGRVKAVGMVLLLENAAFGVS